MFIHSDEERASIDSSILDTSCWCVWRVHSFSGRSIVGSLDVSWRQNEWQEKLILVAFGSAWWRSSAGTLSPAVHLEATTFWAHQSPEASECLLSSRRTTVQLKGTLIGRLIDFCVITSCQVDGCLARQNLVFALVSQLCSSWIL